MTKLKHLFENNLKWSNETIKENPDFFLDLAVLQSPKYLWVGCSDSRVPANQITGLLPGEIFVHRNVANIVVHSDLNCLSVLQYGIDVLNVEQIMVVGHYGCGGVRAALEDTSFGLIDNWLRHIQDVRDKHEILKHQDIDFDTRWKALCELNVIEQVRNAARTTVASQAWKQDRNLTLHGLVYGLDNGRLCDMGVTIDAGTDIEEIVREANLASYRRHGFK